MTPLVHLRSLLQARDRASRADVAERCLAPHFVFHHGLGDLVRADFLDPVSDPFVDVYFLDAFVNDEQGAVVFNGRDPVTDLWHRCAWVFHHRDGCITTIFANNQIVPPPPLKTIKLAPLPSATPELAEVLRSEFHWLNPVPDILRMLRGTQPVNVAEHIKPQCVEQFTTKLEALSLEYVVTEE